MHFDRREFLKTTAAGSLVAAVPMQGYAAPQSGVVRWLMAENTTGNWDPAANVTLANMGCEYLAFDYLLTFPMKPGADLSQINRVLAESFKIIDPFTAEFAIRKGVKFQDGSELTAEDVKASMEHYSRPKVARSVYAAPLRCTVKDKYTVVINTEAAAMPITTFLYVQNSSPILRAKDVADPKALQQRMNGTGPFGFVGQEKGGSVFEANKHYWGLKQQIKRIVVRHVPDSNARVLALLSGEADIIERLEPEQYTSLTKKTGFSVGKAPSVENQFLHFRCNRKPFDDWRMRRAAAAAIDRNAILGIVGDGGYAADSVLPPAKMGYIAQPSYGKFDPAECQKLLAEAGYPKGKGLPELEFITSTGFYPKTKEYCEAIAAMLQAQGFPVKLTVMEVAAWNDRYYNVDAGHMINGGWSPPTPEPNHQLMLMYYSKIALVTGIKDPELDAVLTKQQAENSLVARRALLQEQVLPMVAKKMPNLVLFNSNSLSGMTSRLTGAVTTPSNQIDFTRAVMA